MPFDDRWAGHLVAYVSALASLSLIPRTVLELQSDGRTRLQRLQALLSECGVSVHDLSCVTRGKGPHRAPRFNMPFELGLSVQMGHRWYVFDSKPHRLAEALSDVNGHDPCIHGGKPDGVVRAVYSAMIEKRGGLSVDDALEFHGEVAKYARLRKQQHGTLFSRAAFQELVAFALGLRKQV